MITIQINISHTPGSGFSVNQKSDVSTATPEERVVSQILDMVLALGMHRVKRIVEAYDRGDRHSPAMREEIDRLAREFAETDTIANHPRTN